ncbi:amidohydrolase 2 [Lichtheimia hyalospora FSU 10163]|nr:amidohydrolase 2 [Lichtheimia hyalospora FSU 10163]
MTKDNIIVDVHTHIYLPEYLDMLRERTQVPRILPPLQPGQDERLVILPDEDKGETTKHGRPVGSVYSDVQEKLAFMERHDIDISVVSLANPWLDFLPDTKETAQCARRLNQAMENYCQQGNETRQLYGMATLPLSSIDASIAEVEYVATHLPHIRGVIMGTAGCQGRGLDDPALLPLYAALARYQLVIFLHPHYGVNLPPSNHHDNGHAVALALGFPFETTYAVAQLILAGVLDKVPDLKILLAHAGGTLPFLAGRLDSCVAHDPVVSQRLQHPPSHYLKMLYYDAVIYHSTGVKAAADLAGTDRLLFGTDHPFFPPLEQQETSRWMSVDSNLNAIRHAGFGQEKVNRILGKNALKLFGINA